MIAGNDTGGHKGRTLNTYFSVVPGVHWPAIPSQRGSECLALMCQLDASQWWSAERLRAMQLKQVRQLLRHAYVIDQTWQLCIDRIGFVPEEELAWEMFARLPIVEPKHQPQAAALSDWTPERDGSPLSDAVVLRDHLWHERDLASKQAEILPGLLSGPVNGWGPAVDRVFVTGKSVRLSTDCPPDAQMRWLRREQPGYLFSTAPNVAIIARAFIGGARGLHRLKDVRTAGLPPPAGLGKLCAHAWGATYSHMYSVPGLGPIALQCPERKAFHVQSERVLVEIVDAEGNSCVPGQRGRLIVTVLHDFATPVIRCTAQERAAWAQPCECGRGLPVLKFEAAKT